MTRPSALKITPVLSIDHALTDVGRFLFVFQTFLFRISSLNYAIICFNILWIFQVYIFSNFLQRCNHTQNI